MRSDTCGAETEIATACEIDHLVRFVRDAYTVSWLSRALYAVRCNHTGDWLECRALDAALASIKSDDRAAAMDPNRGVWG